MKRVIISGGGTGGHVYPAIAIADAIKAYNAETEILFVGAEGRMEMEAVPKAGYQIQGLPIAGFHRKLTLKNLAFPFKLVKSMLRARKIVKHFGPSIAIGVGGFASGPVLRVANSLGIPTLIQEQNSYPGVTNKILASKASAICVAYSGMEKFFETGKIVMTGNPVRKDIHNIHSKKEEGLNYFGLDEGKKTIVVMGGSLGAGTINHALASAFELIKNRADVQWIWQCGKYYREAYSSSETAQLPHVKMMDFIDRVDLAYACADLLVCRAGALTLSEICLAGKASVLVPSPNVAEDHQTKNAMALVQVNAARMVADKDASESLINEAFSVIDRPEVCRQLEQNAARLGKPNAASDIALEVAKIIGIDKQSKEL